MNISLINKFRNNKRLVPVYETSLLFRNAIIVMMKKQHNQETTATVLVAVRSFWLTSIRTGIFS